MHVPLLCVENLTKTYPGDAEPVVRDLSFCVHPGEVFALVGPSGCGKTTTLRAIMGFERADSGRVLHDRQVLQDKKTFIPPEKRGIGIVFQDYALFPHLTVRQNVMFGVREKNKQRRRQLANEYLWMVGLMGYDDRRVQDISGGQQQRVALARAMAPGAKVILLDEPFSNLDTDLRQNTRKEVQAIAKQAGLAVVLVTHDQEEALSIADRMGVMNEGTLEQIGTPEDIYNDPTTPFVAQFVGQTNLLEADASGFQAQTALGEVPLDRDATGKVMLSLRPEHIAMDLVPEDAGAVDAGRPAGEILLREFKGHDLTYRVRVGRREYVVQTGPLCERAVGDKVSLRPRREAAVVRTNALPQVTATP